MNRYLTIFLIGIGSLIIIEVIALTWLYLSVNRYKNFWLNKSTQNGEFVYLAYGDSTAQGIGATSPMRGYVGLIAERIEKKTNKTVKIVNLSTTGAKIEDALNNQLNQKLIEKPNLVTIEIGANDIASFDTNLFKKQFSELAGKLPKGTYVSNMPNFGSRPSRQKDAHQATEIIKSIVSSNNNLVYVDLQTITAERGSVLDYAPDFFHPNNRAYRNWADAFWKEIEPGLR